MCGRFTLIVSLEELMLRYEMDPGHSVPYHRPQYNIAPTQMVLSIIHDGSRLRLGELKWGLVPSWAKDSTMGSRMINARSETLLEKPAYRLPFERKRCLIPADGFYEWQKTGNGKRPYRIKLKSSELFSMAGLYDIWVREDGSKLATCTVITTRPNSLMEPIHDRMPVILRPEDELRWIERGSANTEELQQLLIPYPASEMEAYPVSSTVNSVKNDSPLCIEKSTL
ncbi:SOS response-associated peptidase [Paenibacillus dokdonensis]|uniref:Abasic site processing protein n=1 Tax=Paenibacillus dokdonensis TaxID=2567944 RepID=A0ABU6GVZ2_9BACL|nr:SOS response-associated peptidase [Paenibacillus dokdonensis]MEC0243524.1 SOS response-associated peptidase [Paenibacillus dokdonensis]